MKKLVAQIMKFGVVGVIAFVIDYGLLALLTEAFGVNYLVSATISFTASVVFNYAASMRYVFTHKEGMSRRREFAIFVVLSVIGLGLHVGGRGVFGHPLPHREDRRHVHRHGVELRDAQDLPRRRRCARRDPLGHRIAVSAEAAPNERSLRLSSCSQRASAEPKEPARR